ncbi:MAG: NTP transferase domain-containing protein [Deltaproteobacteria bacterium]|nr:NTP transferase domain-containing protein [Deltaproteobacteria bacterium]
MKAVILAGGEGRRLRPYTTILPKPLMPLGQKPILEYVIERLVRAGIRDIAVSVGYLSGLIEAYFGSGEKWNAQLEYLQEATPLGTVGPLHLVRGVEDAFLVINGDILTNVDFQAFASFHQREQHALSIATVRKEVKIDLGVLELNSRGIVTDYREKPVLHHDVSMGVYCCSPRVLSYIPQGQRCDLPDLVKTILRAGEPVGAYRHEGYWLDIGRPEDYERALDELERYA